MYARFGHLSTKALLGLGLIGVLGVAASIAAAEPVYSGPAAFTGLAPADSTLVTVTPVTVSVTASGALPLTGYARFTLDGAERLAGVDYPIGHMDGDEWDEWWVVDDYSVARLYTTVIPGDGSHEVTATVVDSGGTTSTCSWAFDVAVPPRVVAIAPADGSVVTTAMPSLSARITDNDAADAATMTLDGLVVPTTYTAGTRTYSFVPAVALGEGPHAVTFAVRDSGGRTAVREWTFTVDVVADTTFSSLAPVPGSTVTTWVTPISLLVTDTAAVYSWYVKGYVDGVTATVQSNYPIGYWVDDEYEPWFEVSDWGYLEVWWNSGVLTDGTHTVMLRTTNSRGLPATGTWDFEVHAPPRISGALPQKARSLQSTISAYVSDNSTGAVAVTMTVDGSVVAATYDPATHLLAYRPTAPFSDFSTHSVQVEAADEEGNSATHSWEFFVQTVAGARFGSRTPTLGSLLDTSTVAISVTATSASSLTGACSMSLDGVQVPASVSYPIGHWEWDYEDSWYVVDDPGHVVLSYEAAGVRDGTRTVETTVTDSEGLTAHDAWEFRVESPPRAGGLLPAQGSDVSTRTPTIAAEVTDNGTDPITVALTVDGVSVPVSLDATGRLEYVPSAPLDDDATHTVSLDVEDSRGNASHYGWDFRVEVYEDMPDSGICASCHVGYPEPNHPMSNCSGCHHAGNGHGVLLPWTPVQGCSCHGGSHSPYQISGQSEYYYSWQCTDCHKPLYDWIPRHPDDNGVLHETSRALTACRPCHKSELTREHYRYPAGGPKYECVTCHESSSAEVTGAIAAQDTLCESCHGSVGVYHDDHASSQSAALANGERACGGCHEADLWLEHTKATAVRHAEECLLCHDVSDAGTASAPVTAPWDGSCTVADCHAAGSDREMHAQWCLGCHDARQPDFATTKVDFTVPGPVDRVVCRDCHWEPAGGHPYHYPTWNCGSCHGEMGLTNASAIPKVSTAYGFFNTASSATTDAVTLHLIHSNPTWAGGMAKRGRQCVSCHAAAACTACHAEPAPSHSEHTWDAAAAAYRPGTEPGSETFGAGTSAGNELERNVSTALTCSNATCHPKATGASAPYVVEDLAASIEYTGAGWAHSGAAGYSANSYYRSNALGARAGLAFTGQRVELFSDMHPYRGKARIHIDGVAVAAVDLYSPTVRRQVLVYSSPTLPRGDHTIEVEVLREKNAASRDYYVVIDFLRVSPVAELPKANCSVCHAPDTFTGATVDRIQDHGADLALHTVTGDITGAISTTGTVRAEVPCLSACHDDRLDVEHAGVIASALPTRVADGAVSCAECHEDPRKAANTPWTGTKDCADCHAVHDAVLAKHDWSDSSAGCTGPACHEVARIDRVHFDATTTPDAAGNCNVCHTGDQKPVGLLNGGAPATGCEDCHAGVEGHS